MRAATTTTIARVLYYELLRERETARRAVSRKHPVHRIAASSQRTINRPMASTLSNSRVQLGSRAAIVYASAHLTEPRCERYIIHMR